LCSHTCGNGMCDIKFFAGLKVFIGHTESISDVIFMPDSKSLVSFGEAIFVWDFLASESGNSVPSVAE